MIETISNSIDQRIIELHSELDRLEAAQRALNGSVKPKAMNRVAEPMTEPVKPKRGPGRPRKVQPDPEPEIEAEWPVEPE